MPVQHSTVPIILIKLHSITYKLYQDPMKVPRKTIVLNVTICRAQKDCMEMSKIVQILTLGSSDYILIEQIHIYSLKNKQKGPRILYFYFRSND